MYRLPEDGGGNLPKQWE